MLKRLVHARVALNNYYIPVYEANDTEFGGVPHLFDSPKIVVLIQRKIALSCVQ